MRADINANGSGLLHVFNVHLGTAFIERRHQGRKLVNDAILNNGELRGARIMLGDFNEWTRGSVSHLLNSLFEGANLRRHLNRSRTYPGFLPFLHLDHIYLDHRLKIEQARFHRNRLSLIASDHLPLVVDVVSRKTSA